jgi:hypothetical protein
MMKKLVLAIAFILATGVAIAQDVIVMKDGSTLLGKVAEISNEEIKYKKWSNPDGPLYSISRSEIMSINYQNGEVDRFMVEEKEISTREIVKEGRMDRKGQDLTLDGRVLTDDEVRSLIGEQNYQKYLGARKQINAGNTFAGIMVFSMISGLTSFAAICYGITQPIYAVVLVVSSIVTLTTIPLTFVFKGIGKGRMGRIAENYNKHGNAMSIQLSPSLMNCKNGISGFGVTFSMIF